MFRKIYLHGGSGEEKDGSHARAMQLCYTYINRMQMPHRSHPGSSGNATTWQTSAFLNVG